jgi:hypothetical protein
MEKWHKSWQRVIRPYSNIKISSSCYQYCDGVKAACLWHVRHGLTHKSDPRIKLNAQMTHKVLIQHCIAILKCTYSFIRAEKRFWKLSVPAALSISGWLTELCLLYATLQCRRQKHESVSEIRRDIWVTRRVSPITNQIMSTYVRSTKIVTSKKLKYYLLFCMSMKLGLSRLANCDWLSMNNVLWRLFGP